MVPSATPARFATSLTRAAWKPFSANTATAASMMRPRLSPFLSPTPAPSSLLFREPRLDLTHDVAVGHLRPVGEELLVAALRERVVDELFEHAERDRPDVRPCAGDLHDVERR